MSVSSPSHNPVFEVFGDYFWSSDRNITEGVNVLYDASKISVNNTKHLVDLFQDHLEMEREYNKRLRKLSDKVRGVSDEKNTMAPIWKNLSTLYTSMSEIHSQYLKDLAITQKSVSSYSSEEKKTASSLTKYWEQANSLKQQYTKSFHQYSTSKSQFYIASQTFQKSNHLEVGSGGNVDNTEQEGELVRSQDEYKSSLNKHQSSVEQTVSKLFGIFFEFENFEKNRFSKICGIIQEFMSIFSKFFIRVSKIIEGAGEGTKTIENNKESILIDFASRYGTKGHRPISPCYDDPPNVAEMESELGPRPIYRSPSGQSVESDMSKPGTPKPKKSHKIGNKKDDRNKSKAKNFLKKKSKTQPEQNEPSTLNPNFNPEESLSTSRTPSPVETLQPGFVLDEDGYRVRVENSSPQRPIGSTSSSDSDPDDTPRANALHNIHIKQKSEIEKSLDNTAELYMVIDTLKLGAPRSNLSSRKSNSANQLTSQPANSSYEDLVPPLHNNNPPTGLEFLDSNSHTFASKRQSSIPHNSEWDKVSEQDRSRTPTPVDPSMEAAAFPKLSAVPPLISNFSNDFSTPQINAKLSMVPLSKEDEFTFTNNFSNPKKDVNTTPILKSLSFSNSYPAIPLPPPLVALPPPPHHSSILRPKSGNKLSIGNRMIQIIPELEFDSPTHSHGDSPHHTPEEGSRPDSSMSFTSDVGRGSSPGSDTSPIAINFQEKLHVLYKQNELSDRFVKLEGLLTIAFMNNTIESIHQQDLVFALEENGIGGFKCLQQSLLSQTEEEFSFRMDSLREYLLQQRAASPAQSYTLLQALTYSVKVPVSAAPLLLAVTWDCDSMVGQTSVSIEYKYNPDGFPILSPHPLEDVVFTVKYGSKISECELQPAGQFIKHNNTVSWKRDVVSSQTNSTETLSAVFTHFPDLRLSQLVEVSFKVSSTLSSVQFRLKRPGYSVARIKRSLTSGVYKSEN